MVFYIRLSKNGINKCTSLSQNLGFHATIIQFKVILGIYCAIYCALLQQKLLL